VSKTKPDPSAQSMPETLIRAASRLAALMQSEVTLLEDMRAEEIEAQLPDKRAAIKDYRDLLGHLAEQTELLAALDCAAKARLRAAGARLSAATQANARALAAGIEANVRLVRAVALAAHEAHLKGGGYLANGSLGETVSADQPLAVAVNQVL
jgi:hypothetical protein